ncbi:MAG: aminopeptidase P family protein, partial [Clostridia bacterium]|nr:aminopeptidase P family protein [Clostridia bacterium]
SFNKIYALPYSLTGKSTSDKIAMIREEMSKKSCDGHIITSLEEIAWILNLRGSDIKNTPVFFAYMYINTENANLFADSNSAKDVKDELELHGVKLCDYTEFYSFIPAIRAKSVLLNTAGANYAVYSSLDKSIKIVDSVDPAMIFKAIKNQTEIEYVKRMHIHDGLAVARFMHLIKNAESGEYSEISATKKLKQIRERCSDYLGDSFDTICGYKDHAAIIHYKATTDTNSQIMKDAALLVDSGGQYNGATTDITRVFVLGEIDYEFKLHYTAVCCAMLRLQNLKFKSDTRPAVLDMIARQPLWSLGLDYRHGTGHGVGYMLSVHEGPCSIHYANNAPAFKPGMITSDEPGMYVNGKHGIRLENLLLCTEDIKNEYGQFLKFEPLTVAPIDLDAILPEKMEQSDIDALNSYHAYVFKCLSTVCENDEIEWIKHYTRPISKA